MSADDPDGPSPGFPEPAPTPAPGPRSSGASGRRGRRRNSVHGVSRTISYAVAGVCVVAMAFAGLSPTGATATDVVLVVVATATCVWAAATAPWWALTASAAVVAAFSRDLVTLVPAAAAGITMAAVGARTLNAAWLRSLCALAVVFAASRLQVPGPMGTESIVGLLTCTGLAVSGAWRLPAPMRRRTLVASVATVGVAVVASGLFAASAFTSRTALTNGNDQAQRGLDALTVGDVAAAQASFESAARSFGRADQQLGQVWTQPARLVPVVAQHRTASSGLASGAADVSARLATTLSTLDLDSVRVIDGRIDLAAIDALEPRLLELQDTIEVLAEVVADAENPWLVDALQRRLRDTAADVETRREQGETALAAVRRAPAILGADEPKVYFVAFVTPAEVRGSLGFMGNWAELTVDAGEITMSDFGRHTDLSEGGDPSTWRIDPTADGMDEFLDRYGRIGFANRPGGVASPQIWQIVTASPHFPSTGRVIAELYPQSGGRVIDGVFALDAKVMAALLEFTGPISAAELPADADIAGLPAQLDADNAEQFLLFDQYLRFENDNPDRIDALEVLSTLTVERLLAGALPGPTELGRVMAPLASDGHLAAWMVDPDAQELITTMGFDRALPALAGGDGVAVALNNGSGNKIEVFLGADVTYRRSIDPATGLLQGMLTVELTNDAPPSGLPGYVIGNSVGLPPGSNRLLVSLYVPFPYNSATLDGQPVEMTLDTEQGWTLMGHTVDIAPGGTRTLEMTFSGVLDRFGPDVEPLVMLPNLASPPTFTMNDDSPAVDGT
ncbi:hypothetical protein BH23ACT3_BH23ACT3_17930 [soil metagenome]